jgi:hypothetical protein
MDRKDFLKSVCGLGICGCVSAALPDALAEAEPQATPAPNPRLAFASYQVAKMVGFMASATSASVCTEILVQTGRECAKRANLGLRFKGNPEGYFAAVKKAWDSDVQWGPDKSTIIVRVAEGPCGCPLVDEKRMPGFWCNCAAGYHKESFEAVFGHPVQVTLKESKLDGRKNCVFEVKLAAAG